MNPTFKLDLTEFRAAMREYIVTSRRELSEIINSRLFFVLCRVFLLLPPRNPQAERNRLRAYYTEPKGDINAISRKTGKKIGKSRLLRRVHLIVQAKNAAAGNKGLYGEEMKKASAKLLRRAIGSVGYLKAPVAKAIKIINGGHFSQFGGNAGTIAKARPYAGNKALMGLADFYQYESPERSNVALHKGAKSFVQPAKPSFDPTARADMALVIADDQSGRVSSLYEAAFQRAYADEAVEMRRHVAEKMQAVANKFNAVKVSNN